MVPGLHQLLINYLKEDHVNLENLLGKLLIDVVWMPEVEQAMYGSMKTSLQDNLR